MHGQEHRSISGRLPGGWCVAPEGEHCVGHGRRSGIGSPNDHPAEFQEGRLGGFVFPTDDLGYPITFLIISSSMPLVVTTLLGAERPPLSNEYGVT